MRRTLLSVFLGILVAFLVGWVGWRTRDFLKRRAALQAEETWQSSITVANELELHGKYLEAEGALLAMLPETERRFPGGDHLYETLLTLGRVQEAQKAYGDAEPVLLRALEVARTLPPRTTKLAGALEYVANLYQYMGRPAQEEIYLREEIELFKKDLNRYHADLAMSSNQLALVEFDRGDYRAAIPLFEQANENYPYYPGPHHAYMVRNLNELGWAQSHLLQFPTAEKTLQQALALAQQYMAPEDSDFIRTLDTLGRVYNDDAKYDLAEPVLQRANELVGRAATAEEMDLELAVAENLAFVYWKTGRHKQAEELSQQVFNDSTSVLGKDAPQTYAALYDLGISYKENGKYAEAETCLEQAVVGRETIFGPESVQTAEARSDLALVYFFETKSVLAENAAARALSVLEKVYGPDSLDVSTALNRLGLAQRDEGKFSESIAALERALSIRKSKLPANHPWLAISINNLASAYVAAGRRDDALRLLPQTGAGSPDRRAATILVETPDPAEPSSAGAR
jgi:tetratricopeptide (TPR) repeat protein